MASTPPQSLRNTRFVEPSYDEAKGTPLSGNSTSLSTPPSPFHIYNRHNMCHKKILYEHFRYGNSQEIQQTLASKNNELLDLNKKLDDDNDDDDDALTSFVTPPFLQYSSRS
ncbi:hypothetical protein Tco_1241157 [Tanacetum coccineum]